MKHKASNDLYAYWNKLRGENAAPERSQIDPGAIRSALGDTLILSCERGKDAIFRLAGTRVCALFCRELKNNGFQPLFDDKSRREMDELLRHANHDFTGFVAGLSLNIVEGPAVTAELLLLPLHQRGTSDGRLIGVLAPASPPYWLGIKPVQSLTLNTWRHISPELAESTVPKFFDLPPELSAPVAPVAQTAVPGKPVRAFVVLDGGRA